MSTIEKALAKQKSAANKNAGNKVESVEKEDIVVPEEQKIVTAQQDPNKVLNIDIEGLKSRGYLVDDGSRNSIKDECRQIKRKLLNNAFGKAAKTLNNANLIMVSSSKPNEGKTFVSINLALSIALEQDKTVLLVDADVLRPSLYRELGVPETSGLIEYLLGDGDISSSIFNTNIEKLKIIPAGEPHHLSNELLASDKMISLANELSARYPDRIVIFDSPPLIGVTETHVLANLMGQAIVVVEESKTKIADVQKATETLNENLAVGIVINKAIRTHKDLYGYYGYGYEN